MKMYYLTAHSWSQETQEYADGMLKIFHIISMPKVQLSTKSISTNEKTVCLRVDQSRFMKMTLASFLLPRNNKTLLGGNMILIFSFVPRICLINCIVHNNHILLFRGARGIIGN